MNQEQFNQKLGQTLRVLRDLSRLTQDDLAQKTGLSRASIANMETGRQAMSAYQAFQITTVLEFDSMDPLFYLQTVNSGDLFRSSELENGTIEHLKSFSARSVK